MTSDASGRARAKSICMLVLTSLAVVTLLGAAVAPAFAQTTSTWTGGAGNWAPCPQDQGNALWDTCSGDYYPGKLENNDTAIVQGGPVTLGTFNGITIANLSVASGDSVIITPGYLDFTGSSIMNNGAITIGAGNGLFIQAPGNITLSGSGSVSMTDPNARFWGGNGSGATLINQQTIQGQGGLGVEGLAITNQGTISASGGTLQIYPTTMTNTGTIQAQSGATLDLVGATTYNNSGGTIQALDKGSVLLQTNISGGTITTAGSGNWTLAPPGAGAGLISLTNGGTFNVTSGSNLNWTGTITNTGTFNLQGSISTNGTVTYKGSGTVLMNGGQFNGINANPLINQGLIHGAGTFYEVPLTNQATIQADNPSSTLFIDGSSTTNTATLQATGGGTLELETVVNNSGGTIEAQNGSTVILNNGFNGSVNGGTLTTTGTGIIQSQNGVLDGTVNVPTNAGTLDVASGYDLFIQGTINNTGTISVTGNSCVILNQPSTLTGSGTLNMGSGSCIFGSGNSFTNASTIQGEGTIGDSNPMPITNTGTIIANQPNATLFITPNATGFTNNGTLIVDAGSTLDITGLLTNLAKGTLSKGIYNIAGTLDIQGKITTNASNITLSALGAEIFDAFDGVNALAGLTQNKGTLALQNGASITTTTNFSNKGTLAIGAGSGFTAGGTFTQTAKTVTVDGGLTAPAVTVKKGTLQGQGILLAAVTSDATVIAGDATNKSGVLTVGGTYTQNATGILDVAINGTQLGSQYSQLTVSNGASLNGTLSIKLKKGFVPAVGTNFTILTASVVTGQFATVKGTSINSNEHFAVNYNSGSVTLTVASGP